jgi:hypothetical protein
MVEFQTTGAHSSFDLRKNKTQEREENEKVNVPASPRTLIDCENAETT